MGHLVNLFLFVSLCQIFNVPSNSNKQEEVDPIPVIYSTDLYFPIEDGDDVFDLAAVYSLPGVDIKGILLNRGDLQKERPGEHQINQLNRLSGRNIPSFVGLEDKLDSVKDTAAGQIYQDGVQFIIETLRESESRVDFVSVGSLTDIAAAYNREPSLFKEKAGKLLIFIGEASVEDFVEYNVTLDPKAYAAVMNSGLDIYWIPCFDGGLWSNNGNASYWNAKDQSELLAGVDKSLKKYFTYSLVENTAELKKYPIPFLYTPINKDDEASLISLNRNLWCTAVFKILTNTHNKEVFDFKDTKIRVNEDGTFKLNDPLGKKVQQFYIKDIDGYAEKMTKETNDMLLNFPLKSLPGLFFNCLRLDWGLGF